MIKQKKINFNKSICLLLFCFLFFISPLSLGCSKKYDENLESSKYSKLLEILKGKKISILGDSISTYENFSNNTEYNSSLKDNTIVFYKNQISIDDTWWKGLINDFSMELCVNNSQGSMGMLVEADSIKGYERAELLANNKGDSPDLIFVFLGANDLIYNVGNIEQINWETLITKNNNSYNYSTPKTFAEAYSIAIHKMQQKYPDADIILMEQIPKVEYAGGISEAMVKNAVIKELGLVFNLTTVDFIANGYKANNTNLIDYIHPNVNGMNIIKNILIETLDQKYNRK